MTKWNIDGKVCLVTGATDGIGQVTARVLAGMGATVIVHGRSPDKTDRTVSAIRQATGSDRVEPELADFADLDQVRALSERVQARYDRLDVLINNAGVFMLRRTETQDGYETSFAVNHLAPFLLTNLLLDVIQASAPARIVNVASAGHRRGKLDFDDLHSTQSYRPMRAYGGSKLANLLFTYELARRLDGTGVTVNALHPGLVGTNLAMNNLGPLASLGRWVFRRFAISPEEGAQTIIYLATSPEVAGVTGKYFAQQQERPSSPASYDQTAQRRLWDMSERLTGLKPDKDTADDSNHPM